MRDNWDGQFPLFYPKTPIPLCTHARRDEQGRAIIFSTFFWIPRQKLA